MWANDIATLAFQDFEAQRGEDKPLAFAVVNGCYIAVYPCKDGFALATFEADDVQGLAYSDNIETAIRMQSLRFHPSQYSALQDFQFAVCALVSDMGG